MKRILVLLVVLFSIGFSKDLTELGDEAYDKGDYQKAAELYQKACDSGETMGCFTLGFLYLNGQGVKQDYQKATELYQKACDGGDAKGCFNLGVLYHNGQGVNQDYQKAAQLYQKACDEGEAMGCLT
ncbi:tetratricopeptide repeat protein [Campylobacter concisus]|uniref:tetratricopeptide repeat protein n=1 Tax=Campylobacter concisus TaxID=199 RepID=UPI000CD9A0C8|nr:tetratricopeptide repeat protein [Campylobacter concisus]